MNSEAKKSGKKGDPDQHPALRISNVVYGRKHVGNRVKYLLDPRGRNDECAIPEMVVLKRWRQRKWSGHTFSGVRLSPTIWRAWGQIFNQANVYEMSPEGIREALEVNRDRLRANRLTPPAPEAIHALACYCGHSAIQELVSRHADLQLIGESGVPDLFLYAMNVQTKRVAIARFVEVKKPDEPVSKSQRGEINFLRILGLHARVLRLIERK